MREPDSPETYDERGRGAPYCGDCGYDLTGATDSAKCPECGRPIVEVLMRPAFQVRGGGKRWRSRAQIMGMPAVDIAIGPLGDDPVGRARGFIAIGTEARGMLAIGGRAYGLVAVGGFAMGGFTFGGMSLGALSAFGGMACGLFASGGWAVGAFAQGGGAAGWIAQGGMAFGWFARGGAAFGLRTISAGGARSDAAQAMFDRFALFFGSGLPTVWSIVGSVLLQLLVMACVGGTLAVIALRAIGRSGERGGA